MKDYREDRRRPICDECGFLTAYLVAGPNGELRLCGGCFADLKATGARAKIVRFPVRSAA